MTNKVENDRPRSSRGLDTIASLARDIGAPAILIVVFCLLPMLTWLGFAASGLKPWRGVSIGGSLIGFVDPPAAYSGNPFDHSFQKSVEQRYSTALIFRPLLVKLNNELDYRLLKTSRMYFGNIAIGKGGVLFEKPYIADVYNYGRNVPDNELEKATQDLLNLRGLLASHGIALAIIGTPNKVTLVPDAVPTWFPHFDPERPRPYARLANLLKRADLPFYDGRATVMALGNERGAMFPRGGTHWTTLAAFAALDDPVASILAQQTGRPGRMVLENVSHQTQAGGTDSDLLSLLNLIYPDTSYGSDVIALRREDEALSRPIIVFGSSFTGQMHWVLDAAKLSPSVNSIRYLSLLYRCPACAPEPLEADWPKLVKGASAVVLEMNETHFFLRPYGESYTKKFIDQLLIDLGGT